MAQPALKFACSECGQSTGRWLGRCPGCGSFGTLVEESAPATTRGGKAAVPPRPLLKLVEVEAEEADRMSTGVSELDRVLGGGLVPASLVLVGGEPGVGKSTLLLMALASMSKERRALLVTGEESAAQVKLAQPGWVGRRASRSSPTPTSTRSARRSSRSARRSA